MLVFETLDEAFRVLELGGSEHFSPAVGLPERRPARLKSP
ncbi:MAG: hypothetical protein Ct9H300mP16_18840 [Pseudomonadota bacterium]|nr:MAG: hypothetical protein Ct9H300mP16_18840 [Pseudomonadota bacterium]